MRQSRRFKADRGRAVTLPYIICGRKRFPSSPWRKVLQIPIVGAKSLVVNGRRLRKFFVDQFREAQHRVCGYLRMRVNESCEIPACEPQREPSEGLFQCTRTTVKIKPDQQDERWPNE